MSNHCSKGASNSSSFESISARTRTKYSLASVDIEELESFLTDGIDGNDQDPQIGYNLNEDELEYQRFLSSLLPNPDASNSFLADDDDEDDDEYNPEEEEKDSQLRKNSFDFNVEDDICPSSATISKRELTDLLLDSSLSHTSSNIQNRHGLISRFSGKEILHSSKKNEQSQLNIQPCDELRSRLAPGGTIGKQQCLQLASQLHKHFQLLIQNAYIASSTASRPAATITPNCKNLTGSCNNSKEVASSSMEILQRYCKMLRDLNDRGTVVKKCKEEVLSKSGSFNRVDSTTGPLNKEASGKKSGKDTSRIFSHFNFRRMTRSLTAAHAVLVNPSIYEISGIFSISEIIAYMYSNIRNSAGIIHQSILSLAGGNSNVPQLFNENFKKKLLVWLSAVDHHLLPSFWDKSKKCEDVINDFALNKIDEKPQSTKTTLNYHRKSSNRKAKSKSLFSLHEDNLLAHGVRQYGIQQQGNATHWEDIRRRFLPVKSTDQIRHRYRYLKSTKSAPTASNPVKAYHEMCLLQQKKDWLPEEDARIVRGFIDFTCHDKIFSRISMQLLPHRSRSDIRKRWGNLKSMFGFHTDSEEGKERMKAFLNKQSIDNDSLRKMPASKQMSTNQMRPKPVANKIETCPITNYHPALFLTPWAQLETNELFQHICKHNWTSFANTSSSNVINKYLPNSPILQFEKKAIGTTNFDAAKFPGSIGLSPIPRSTEDKYKNSELNHVFGSGSESDDSDFEQEELLSSSSDDEVDNSTVHENYPLPSSSKTDSTLLRKSNLNNNEILGLDRSRPTFNLEGKENNKRMLALEKRMRTPSHSYQKNQGNSIAFITSQDDEFECEELLSGSDSDSSCKSFFDNEGLSSRRSLFRDDEQQKRKLSHLHDRMCKRGSTTTVGAPKISSDSQSRKRKLLPLNERKREHLVTKEAIKKLSKADLKKRKLHCLNERMGTSSSGAIGETVTYSFETQAEIIE